MVATGGLASASDADVQRVARQALNLYDSNPHAAGAQHAQSQRFLNSEWGGLREGSQDPPLRPLIESIADGEMMLADFFLENNPTPAIISLLKWLSAFRHVTQHAIERLHSEQMYNTQYTNVSFSQVLPVMVKGDRDNEPPALITAV